MQLEYIIVLGKDTPPALSLHGRPKELKPDNFPAPGDYNPDKAEKVIHDNSPKYTFGLKTNVEKPLETPGKFIFIIYAIKLIEKLTCTYIITYKYCLILYYFCNIAFL